MYCEYNQFILNKIGKSSVMVGKLKTPHKNFIIWLTILQKHIIFLPNIPKK